MASNLKLFVWDFSETYETCVAYALAETLEEAISLLKAEGHSYLNFNGSTLEYCGNTVRPDVYDEPFADIISHSG